MTEASQTELPPLEVPITIDNGQNTLLPEESKKYPSDHEEKDQVHEDEKVAGKTDISSPELQEVPSENKDKKTIILATIKGTYHFEKCINFLEELPHYFVFGLWIFVSCMIWTSDIACYFPENTIINIAINGLLPFCNNNGYVYYNWALLIVSLLLGIFLRCRDKIINTILRGEYFKLSNGKLGLLHRNIFIYLFFKLSEIKEYLSKIKSYFGKTLPFKHFVFRADEIKVMHKLLRTKYAKYAYLMILILIGPIFIFSIILQIINNNHFTNMIGIIPFKIYSFLFILKCYECIKYEDIISCSNRDINHLLQNGQQNARFEVSNEKFMNDKEENVKIKIKDRIKKLMDEKRPEYYNLSIDDLEIDFDESENMLAKVNAKNYAEEIRGKKITEKTKNELIILNQLLQFHNKYSEEDGPDILLTFQDFDEYKKYKTFDERLLRELLKDMPEFKN